MFKLLKKLRLIDIILIFLVVILIFTQVQLELKMPEYMSTITKLIQSGQTNISPILENGLYMLLCALGAMVLSIIFGFLVALMSSRFSFVLRKDLNNKILNLSMEEINDFSTSSLITRLTNDVSQMEMVIGMGLIPMIRSPLMAILALNKIVNKGIEWSIATAIAVFVTVTTVVLLIVIVIPRFERVQKLIDKLSNYTREHIIGIRVVRAFNAEKFHEKRFDKVNNDLTKLQTSNQRAFAILTPVLNLVMFGLTLAIYLIGYYMIDSASLANKVNIFGNMIVFSSYAMQVIFSFMTIAFVVLVLSRAKVSAGRINEVLERSISIKEGNIKESPGENKEILVFKNVDFKYPDAEEYILKDINLKVNRGERVAIIGSTGSGKTSLVNLMVRFYDPTNGQIILDGIDIKNYSFEYLYDKISYVSQKPKIFDMSVSKNILFGKNDENLDENIVKKSIEMAQAKDFVENMEDSYNSNLSRGGMNISGGQKQRISIARALSRKSDIYIFDDSFSALDFKTESLLKENLNKEMKNSCLIVISSRVASIMDFDKIIVLENGKIEGFGSHKDLLNNCDVYKEIVSSQLSKEEI